MKLEFLFQEAQQFKATDICDTSLRQQEIILMEHLIFVNISYISSMLTIHAAILEQALRQHRSLQLKHCE
jgi:hypothetical protein